MVASRNELAEPVFRRLFSASPTPLLVVAPDPPLFTIVEVNETYLAATMTTRQGIIGRPLFGVFPDNPDEEDATGVANLRASLERVFASRRTDRMPVQKYSMRRPAGEFVERWWDVVNTPVLDDAGEVVAIIHQAIDVTVRERAEAAVQEGEARFRNMADHAPVMMWVTDPTGACTYLNRRWYEFTGQTEPEAQGFGWLDATHPDDKERAGEIFMAANKAREPFRLEYRLRRADGLYRWAIDAASPRFADNGSFLGYVGSVIDIDERREAEHRLRASEERYRVLFDSIDAGFCIAEVTLEAGTGRALDYRIVEANPAFARHTGLGNVIGRSIRQAVPGLEEYWFETYGRVARTGEPVRFENRAGPIGERWFDVFAFRIGKPEECRVAILFNDISERRQMEERLRELNAKLQENVAQRTAERDEIWGSSQDLMLVADFEGIMLAVNPAWETVLGWPEAELVGRRFIEFIHPEDLDVSLAEAARLAMERAGTTHFENRYRRKAGGWAWLSWAVSSKGDRFYAVARDVTGEKQQAEALAQAQEALRQAQKMEAVGQLTGGIAHDFNNLLAGIVGSLELMQNRIRQGRAAEIDRYVSAAMTSAQRAAALTHRLLAFSRRAPLDPRPVDANQLVAGMEDMLRRTLGPAISLEMVLAGGLWRTLCDPVQLESGLLNLCINARDAMPEGGKLTIQTANAHLDEAYAAVQGELAPGQYIVVSVADTGTGMSPEVIARAFDPFFTTKPIGQGTGLGLSMVYGFAKQSQGDVRIDSQEGVGTIVTLYLPRFRGRASDEGPNRPTAEQLRAESADQTVLVVEDDPVVRNLILEVLADLGYRTLEATDGPSGLRILQADQPIDLLLTDVGLPGINGRQLADQARERRPDLKVLFITGYAEKAMLADGILEPGMQLITKPFSIGMLAQKIKQAMGDGGSGAGGLE